MIGQALNPNLTTSLGAATYRQRVRGGRVGTAARDLTAERRMVSLLGDRSSRIGQLGPTYNGMRAARMGARPPGVRALTADWAQNILGATMRHRAFQYGLMGAGALGVWNNARDGRFGRAALWGGASYAGYHLYKNPALAQGLARQLVRGASNPRALLSGWWSAASTALRATRG